VILLQSGKFVGKLATKLLKCHIHETNIGNENLNARNNLAMALTFTWCAVPCEDQCVFWKIWIKRLGCANNYWFCLIYNKTHNVNCIASKHTVLTCHVFN